MVNFGLSYLRYVFDQGDGQFHVRADVDKREPRDDSPDAQANEHGKQDGRDSYEPLTVETHLFVRYDMIRILINLKDIMIQTNEIDPPLLTVWSPRS